MDKSLSKILIGLFGISGIAIVVFACLRPMPDAERIITILVGTIGLAVASVQSMRLKNRNTALPVKATSSDSP